MSRRHLHILLSVVNPVGCTWAKSYVSKSFSVIWSNFWENLFHGEGPIRSIFCQYFWSFSMPLHQYTSEKEVSCNTPACHLWWTATANIRFIVTQYSVLRLVHVQNDLFKATQLSRKRLYLYLCSWSCSLVQIYQTEPDPLLSLTTR